MKKPHLITAGLLALAAIAAAQATTAAQSLIRVLEIAGVIEVAAQDASVRNSVTWATSLTQTASGAGPVTETWFVPAGHKAKLTFGNASLSAYSRIYLNVGGVEVETPSVASLGATEWKGLVLDAGDSVTAHFEANGNFNYPLTSDFVMTFTLVEL
jgi:hypothetical protein